MRFPFSHPKIPVLALRGIIAARPGMINFDLALLRSFPLSETKALQFRLETFHAFNHTQFFGPVAADGDFNSSTFGKW